MRPSVTTMRAVAGRAGCTLGTIKKWYDGGQIEPGLRVRLEHAVGDEIPLPEAYSDGRLTLGVCEPLRRKTRSSYPVDYRTRLRLAEEAGVTRATVEAWLRGRRTHWTRERALRAAAARLGLPVPEPEKKAHVSCSTQTK